MSTLLIDSINYIVTGSRQKILNFDIVYPNNKKEKNVSFFTDNEAGTYSNNTNNFTYHSESGNTLDKNYNEYGFVFTQMSSNVIRTLYDFKDIALKSSIAERISNRETESEILSDNNVEIYFPHFIENPIGFIQTNGYSYGITNKTVVSPLIKQTNFLERKNSLSSDTVNDNYQRWQYFLNPYDKYGSTSHDSGTLENLIPIYLYTPLDNLKSIVLEFLSTTLSNELEDEDLSASTISKIEKETIASTSSYYSFVQFFKSKDIDILSNLFTPIYNFKNVKHNYIMEIPLANYNVSELDNNYRLGLVNADIIVAKNSYDDLYDTNTNNNGIFKRIREYKSINSTGSKIFLTFYDDNEYNPINENFKSEETYDSISGNIVNVIEKENQNIKPKRDYMKLECVDAINRFTSTTMHKANLYSTKVFGLDKLLPDNKYSAEYKSNIKQDIKNSIRRIISNFAPAHTQYFDVVEFSRENLPTADKEFC